MVYNKEYVPKYICKVQHKPNRPYEWGNTAAILRGSHICAGQMGLKLMMASGHYLPSRNHLDLGG